MYKFVFVCCCFGFVFIGCKPHTDLLFNNSMLNTVPDSIIQPDKMIDVLTDVHIAESAAQVMRSDSIKADTYLQEFYPQILAHHQINMLQLSESYYYYAEHPLMMNYIYRKIIEKINMLDDGKGGEVKNSVQKPATPSNPLRPDLNKIDSIKK